MNLVFDRSFTCTPALDAAACSRAAPSLAAPMPSLCRRISAWGPHRRASASYSDIHGAWPAAAAPTGTAGGAPSPEQMSSRIESSTDRPLHVEGLCGRQRRHVTAATLFALALRVLPPVRSDVTAATLFAPALDPPRGSSATPTGTSTTNFSCCSRSARRAEQGPHLKTRAVERKVSMDGNGTRGSMSRVFH